MTEQDDTGRTDPGPRDSGAGLAATRALPPSGPIAGGWRPGRLLTAVAGALAALVLLSSATCLEVRAAGAAADGTLQAQDLVALIDAGHSVELTGATVLGDVDLRSVDHVSHVVRCTDCTFAGSFIASNVILDRIVDLSGAAIRGRLDLSGAVLADAFLLGRSATRAASVAGQASLSLTTFAGRAAFDGTAFGGGLDLGGAQLRGPASFADSEVVGSTRFDAAILSGDVDFGSAPADLGTASGPPATMPPASLGCPSSTAHALEGSASFAGTTFGGKVDFRARCFGSGATFAGAQFGAANFGLAVFLGRAVFDGAAVGGDLSLRAATFSDDVSLQQVLVRGTADFDGAVFRKSVQLFRTTVLGLASFRQVLFGGSLEVGSVQLMRLHISLDDLDHIPGEVDRERMLSAIELTAREDGDLAVANDAALLRSSIQSSRDTGLQRLGDVVAEQAGGYLIKPFYPLRAILALLALGTLVRTLFLVRGRLASRPGSAQAAAGPPPATTSGAQPSGVTAPIGEVGPHPVAGADPGPMRHPVAPLGLRTGRASSLLLKRSSELILFVARSASASLHAALRGQPADLPADADDRLADYGVVLLAGAEWLAYKVLAGLFLIGLANSNPVLKQLLEAVSR
jgi:hypothetical protein